MRFKEIYRNSRVHWRCAHEGIMSCQIYDDAVEGESFFFPSSSLRLLPRQFFGVWLGERVAEQSRARARDRFDYIEYGNPGLPPRCPKYGHIVPFPRRVSHAYFILCRYIWWRPAAFYRLRFAFFLISRARDGLLPSPKAAFISASSSYISSPSLIRCDVYAPVKNKEGRKCY